MEHEEQQIGFRRKKNTEPSETFNPENKETQNRTFPEKTFQTPKKKLTTKDLPKSIRISIEAHTAIATIATIEDLKIYEVINMLLENHIADLPSTKQKLVKNSVKQVMELKNV
mgnify:CR=1 FL=1